MVVNIAPDEALTHEVYGEVTVTSLTVEYTGFQIEKHNQEVYCAGSNGDVEEVVNFTDEAGSAISEPLPQFVENTGVV